MKNLIALTILLSLSTVVNAECYNDRSSGNNEMVGTLLGAAVGGLIGSQIGGGSGRTIAITAGVLAGGFVGNNIGSRLDCEDRDYHYDTAQSALEYKKTGGTAAWVNPDSGASGSIRPTRTYVASSGKPCRDFTQIIEVDGEEEEVNATACRQEDGTWQIIDT